MNYFKDREFACRDGTPYPVRWRKTRLRKLRGSANKIRRRAGVPLSVLSGYRTPKYNRKVGGARRSQHPQGLAMDIRARGITVKQLFELIMDMKRAGDLPDVMGIGYYPGRFVHIDVRPSKRLHRWKG